MESVSRWQLPKMGIQWHRPEYGLRRRAFAMEQCFISERRRQRGQNRQRTLVARAEDGTSDSMTEVVAGKSDKGGVVDANLPIKFN